MPEYLFTVTEQQVLQKYRLPFLGASKHQRYAVKKKALKEIIRCNPNGRVHGVEKTEVKKVCGL
jgi:hypothetical protein